MAKRGLMDRVKAAAERVGEPVARTLVRTTAAAVRTMDKLQHATAKAKPSTVARSAAKVATKTAKKTATRAADTVRSAAGRARKGPRSAPGADVAEAQTIDARAAAAATMDDGSHTGVHSVDAASDTQARARTPRVSADQETTAARATPARGGGTGRKVAASAAEPAAAKRTRAPAAAKKTGARAKKQAEGFKVKRGQKHRHHR